MGTPQFQPEQIPVTLTQTLSCKERELHYMRGLEEGEIKQSQPILDHPLVVKGR
ncbi:unnamed protein product, partial [marine sediment metagenome]